LSKNISIKQEVVQTIKLAIPIIIDQLGTVLMGMADTIQVGHISKYAKESIGAAAISNAIFFTVAIVGLIAIQIAAPMIANKNSENNHTEISKLWHSSIAFSLFLACSCFIIIEILAYNFDIFGQTATIKRLALPFLHLWAVSIFPLFLFTALRQLPDGLGNTRLAMYITLAAVVLNIVLNTILIYGTAYSPAYGLLGAGMATLFSRVLMCIGIYVVLRWQYSDFFSIRFFEKSRFTYLLKIGLPSGMQGFFEVALFGSSAVLMGKLGELQLAAHNIALNPASVSYMMVMGLSVAGGIRVGANLGKPKALKTAGWVALVLGLLFMSCTGSVFLLANQYIAQAYINDSQVIGIAVELLVIAGFFQLSDGLQGVALGVLRGLKDVKIPTIITFIAYWLVGLPCSYYLAFTMSLGAKGIWYGLTIGLSTSALLLVTRFWYLTKNTSNTSN
jgi:multidrug resistance protein, MATE family